MDVYMFSGSAHSWRVLLALAIKGQNYAEKALQPAQSDLKSPEFLKLNPRGKVPVIRDGTHVLAESLAILAYLDRKYPKPPLFGDSAKETGAIWRAMLDFDLYVSHDWVAQIIVPIFTGQVAAKAETIKAAMPAAHRELTRLEAATGKTGWIAGPALSAADLVVFPHLEALVRAAGKSEAKPLGLELLPFERHYPALDAWRQKIKRLPAFEQTYPAFWRKVDQAAAA